MDTYLYTFRLYQEFKCDTAPQRPASTMHGSKLSQSPGPDKPTEDTISDFLKVDTGRPYWVDTVMLRIFFVVTNTTTGVVPFVKKTRRNNLKSLIITLDI